MRTKLNRFSVFIALSSFAIIAVIALAAFVMRPTGPRGLHFRTGHSVHYCDDMCYLDVSYLGHRGWKPVFKSLNEFPVTGISVYSEHLDRKVIRRFVDESDLQYLVVINSSFERSALEEFRRCRNLRRLAICGAEVINKNGRKVRFDDREMQTVAKIKSLQWLTVNYANVSGDGILHLKDIDLTHLDLQRTSISDTDLSVFANFDNLEYLHLRGTRITEQGLSNLYPLKQLKTVNVRHNEISPTAARLLSHEIDADVYLDMAKPVQL